MSLHKLEKTQCLPISLHEAWDFISSPENLKTITPDYMRFEITSQPLRYKMYPGMIITYKVRPVLGIPINWATEITQVNEPVYFIDEQLSGPYAFWHHQHFLKEIEGGVEMMDLIHYKIPLGFLGDMMNLLFVKRQLKGIFQYRFDKLIELFGPYRNFGILEAT